MAKLVIVESPTKSKKIQGYLPKGFVVDACMGHVRDLPSSKAEIPEAVRGEPWADYGVDVDHAFAPVYVTIKGKDKVLKVLRSKLKEADELYLATDPDREGESISWHLQEILKPKVPVHRIAFDEITKEAVQAALAHPRDVDLRLVQAQETRRILDRLYGYALSPLLWKKVGGNLSAGRVQSVAVRLVVMRERERRAFKAATYWDLKALLRKDGDFEARLQSVGGRRVARGDDFDKETGRVAAGRDVLVLEEAAAKELQARVRGAVWTVVDVKEEARQSSPKPPFTTSTLQQEANNRLNLSARDTMQAAQRLFENGFITYMRTDSTVLSEEGLSGAKKAIEAEFGTRFLHPAGPRRYEGKQAKNAQEAHEAIRPAGADFAHPDRSGLTGRDLDLYRLIWRRTLASQMANERYTSTTAQVQALEALFVATGKSVEFPGYRIVYDAAEEDDKALPPLAKGDRPECRDILAEGHETKPPARYTEASLVAALDKEGIGRPSTYASILDTIESRGYVLPKGKALVPSFTAFAVVGLLEKNFPTLVDLKFTARMEESLDEISAGEADWVKFLREFFHGADGLAAQVAGRMKSLDPADARVVDLGSGLPYTVKIGRFGPYVEMQREGAAVTASLPESLTPDELDAATVERLIEQKAEGPQSLGNHPETGKPVYLLEGRFGPYVQHGDAEGDAKPPRSSLPRGVKPESCTLEDAVFLLSLPRPLGPHPDGGRVVAGLGRFGPYIAHQKPDGTADYRSLRSFDEMRHILLDAALALLSVPKAGRGRGVAPKVLRDLGAHPADGAPVQVLDGRYGPYLKHGDTNATLPKGNDPATVTMEDAVRLLEEKRAKGPAPKRRRKR